MELIDGLHGLSEPKNTEKSISVKSFKKEQALRILEKMLKIRAVEKQIAQGKEIGLIGGPVHLGVGQEAVATGVSESLRSTDRVFGAHRSHSHLLAIDMRPRALFAEVLGRKTGFSRGMGGSMHLWSKASGFYGSVPIVSGTVPLAVGAGIAANFQKEGDIAVAYLGDGAVEEGVVHESLNLARIQNVPVLFVVENNLFASHMHISMRQPNSSTTRFAKANEIPCAIVDGNDVASVHDIAKTFITRARDGNGPAFIEVVTYRWYGHVDWREDIDVGVNRSSEDLNDWKQLDPIARLKTAMVENCWISNEDFSGISNKINQNIKAAWQLALNDPFPEDEALMSAVYNGAFGDE